MDVATMGTFDAMHPGHIGLLQRCAELGPVAVALNTDFFVRQFKHVTPIFTLEERKIMAAACKYVGWVFENDGDRQPDLIKEMLPRGGVLVIGDDWAAKDYLAQIGLADDRTFLTRNRIKLAYVPRTGNWSTAEVRERLA